MVFCGKLIRLKLFFLHFFKKYYKKTQTNIFSTGITIKTVKRYFEVPVMKGRK